MELVDDWSFKRRKDIKEVVDENNDDLYIYIIEEGGIY